MANPADALQLFTHPKSLASRKAERFFSERRVMFHAVDVRRKPPTPAELRKWVQRFGVDGVVDRQSKPFVDGGLRYLSASDEDWIVRLCRDPTALALPLVRCGRDLAVGDDPDAWARFAAVLKGS